VLCESSSFIFAAAVAAFPPLALSHDNKLYNVQTLNIEINKKRKAEFYERKAHFCFADKLAPSRKSRLYYV
jgi:hypothetical protein